MWLESRMGKEEEEKVGTKVGGMINLMSGKNIKGTHLEKRDRDSAGSLGQEGLGSAAFRICPDDNALGKVAFGRNEANTHTHTHL